MGLRLVRDGKRPKSLMTAFDRIKQNFYYNANVYFYSARYTIFDHPCYGELLSWFYYRLLLSPEGKGDANR
jgi:hypothetical protein